MHVTFVKKIKADGTPCRKCAQIEQRLRDAGLMARIDEVVIADERDAQSTGVRLAARHNVDAAPFFIVRDDSGTERVYSIYFKFVKEVLGAQVSEQDEAKEILEHNPGVDFL